MEEVVRLAPLKVGDVIVVDDGEEARFRVVEVLGRGETESGHFEDLRYKTAIVGGSWANTTMIEGHIELSEYHRLQEVRIEIERK